MLLTTGLSLPPGQCYKRVAWGPDGHIAAACDRMVHFLDARTGEVVDRVEDAHDAPVRLRVCPWAVCACGQSVAWAGRDCGSAAVLGARCCAGLRGQGRRDAHALCHAAASWRVFATRLGNRSSCCHALLADHLPGVVEQQAARPAGRGQRAGDRRAGWEGAALGSAAEAGVRQRLAAEAPPGAPAAPRGTAGWGARRQRPCCGASLGWTPCGGLPRCCHRVCRCCAFHLHVSSWLALGRLADHQGCAFTAAC